MRQLANYSSLVDAKVEDIPNTAYYLPNFITPEEESNLIYTVNNRPARDWTELTNRRLQTYPSSLVNNKLIEAPLPLWLQEPTVTRLLSIPLNRKQSQQDGQVSGPQNPIINHLFSEAPHNRPNHCLVNEYKPGQGIFPHEDGPAYHPVVATVSLGAPIVLDIYEKGAASRLGGKPSYRILQEARSLLITTDDLYTDYLHGIGQVLVDKDLSKGSIANWHMLGDITPFRDHTHDRQTRLSLTFRDVKQTSRTSKLFPGLFRK